MSHINAFSTRVPSSASASASAPFAAEQPHQRSHISTFTGFHHHNVSAMLQIHGDSSIVLNSQPVKAKRVTAPLNEAVREILCGNRANNGHRSTPLYSTSGSDHGIDSVTLTDMSFLEEEEMCGGCSRPDFPEGCGNDTQSSGVQHSIPFWGEQLYHMLQGVSSSTSIIEVILIREVNKAIVMAAEKAELFTQEEGHEKSNLQRFVMSSLRSAGYDAAICKTRWEQSNGYPAGVYEFIDVIAEASSSDGKSNDRVLVDMDFRQQFEIARPTAQYAALLELLPTLFVGRADKLRDIIKIMSDGAKRSLKAKGMHLPPWRKYRYAQVKWLGSYKRTTNPVASTPTDRLLLREIDGNIGIAWNAGVMEEPIDQGNGLQCFVGVPVVGKRSRREAVRFSGLATALAEAACS